MANSEVAAYFRSLSELALGTRVTCHNGALLSLEAGMSQMLELLMSLGAAGKVMVVGNGGSAAIASHVHNDLCKAVGARAMVFNEAPLLTALANDIDYASAFEKLVELWAMPSDLLLAISSSGRSINILRAVKACQERECRVATFSGFRADNPLRRLGQINFYVPSENYGQVEVVHNALLHFLIDQAIVACQGKNGSGG